MVFRLARISTAVATAVSLIAFSAGASSARAETLMDALIGAYQHSGLLDQNRALLRAADEDLSQAASTLLPVLRWQADAQRTFGDAEQGGLTRQLEQTTVSAQLIASWQVYDYGANAARIESRKETVLATRSALLSVEQSVLLRAVQAFMNVGAIGEVVAIRENNIRLLTQELRAAQDRFDVGEVTRTDVALAESALAAARSDLAAAEANLVQAREEYRNAVGRYPVGLVRPTALPRVERDMDRAKAFAVRNHPDLKRAQHEVSANEALIIAAEADLNPTVSLLGSIRIDEEFSSPDSSDSASIGVRVTGPIYQGGALSSVVRQARARRDAARGNLHVVRHDVHADVGDAYADFESSGAQIEASERRIRAARVAFEGVREEATLGARTTLDVLDAEQELFDAQASLVQAQAGQFIAAYRVLESMGLLTAQQLNLPVQIYDPTEYFDLVKDGAPALSKQGRQLDRVMRALNK